MSKLPCRPALSDDADLVARREENSRRYLAMESALVPLHGMCMALELIALGLEARQAEHGQVLPRDYIGATAVVRHVADLAEALHSTFIGEAPGWHVGHAFRDVSEKGGAE